MKKLLGKSEIARRDYFVDIKSLYQLRLVLESSLFVYLVANHSFKIYRIR